MSDSGLRSATTFATAFLALTLAGCAHRGTVVLLPEKDGNPTAVVVQENDRKTVLDKPYAAVQQTPFGLKPYTSTPEEVQAKFGAALASQPQRAVSFTLYFVEGKDEFTDESKRVVDTVFAEIAKRPVADVIVIGHTDTVGNDALNDALSRQRADVVRAAFAARGLAADKVVTIGRGKRELAVPTGDGVAEPRNRRVEILVR